MYCYCKVLLDWFTVCTCFITKHGLTMVWSLTTKIWNTLPDFHTDFCPDWQSGRVSNRCQKSELDCRFWAVRWQISHKTASCMTQISFSFRKWFHTVWGYQTCLISWADLRTHTEFMWLTRGHELRNQNSHDLLIYKRSLCYKNIL